MSSVDSSSHEESTSLFYAVLPPLIKRSVPNVRSLRHSISGYSAASAFMHARYPSTDSTTAARTGSITPPPPYQDPLSPLTSVLSDDEDQEDPLPTQRPLAHDPINFADSERAGIRREFASQGLSLLTLSAQGSSFLSSNPEFSRQMYIDSVSYLLRGLPATLSEGEELRLRAAIPQKLFVAQPNTRRVVLRGQRQDSEVAECDEHPTILHRVVAMIVLRCFLLFSFLWPYIQTISRDAYQYEREHHISERFLAQSWSTANNLSKSTLTLAKTVCSWNDGQVGVALEDVAFWWVQGVSGGLREGVQGGMEIFGVKPIDHRGKSVAGR